MLSGTMRRKVGKCLGGVLRKLGRLAHVNVIGRVGGERGLGERGSEERDVRGLGGLEKWVRGRFWNGGMFC